MNNPYSHLKRRESKQRRTSSILPVADPPQPNKATTGLTNQFLHARRENILNTGYNKRKSKLESITLENKKIYVRCYYSCFVQSSDNKIVGIKIIVW